MLNKYIFFFTVLIITLLLACLFLVSCTSSIDNETLLNVKDHLEPVITIVSPDEGSFYASNVLVTGYVMDSSQKDGDNRGTIRSLYYQVLATSIGGEVALLDNNFSFIFPTQTLTGNITILLVAVDWNNNITEKYINLLDGGNDIPSLTATAENRSITLDWDVISGATGYTLYYTTDGSYPNIPEGTNGLTVSKVEPGFVLNTYIHDGDPFNTDRVKNGQMHVFRLRAHFAPELDDSWSDYVKAIPLSRLTLSPKVTKDRLDIIDIWWYDIPAEVGYQVYRAENKDGPYYQLTDTLSEAQYRDNNVTDGVTYYYKIKPEKYNNTFSYPMPGKTTTLDFSHKIAGLELGSHPGTNTIVGNRLYMSSYDEGFHILDITDPSKPLLINTSDLANPSPETPMSISGIAVKGDYAYISAHDKPLFVVGINPAITGEYLKIVKESIQYLSGSPTGTMGKDIAIEGDYAFSTNYERLFIYDVTNPGDPVRLKELYLKPNIDFADQIFVDPVNEMAYVCGSYTDKRGLAIIDISGPPNFSSLSVIATYTMDTAANQVQIAGDYAYIASDEGIRIVNILDPPNNFSNYFTFESGRSISDLAIVGNYLYAVVENKGLYRYFIPDFRDPSGMYLERIYKEVITGNLSISGEIAYVSDPYEGTGGLSVVYSGDDFFDLTDRPVVTFNDYGVDQGITDIDIYNDTIFSTIRTKGLETVRFTPPATFDRLGSYKAQAGCLGVKVVGDLAFVAEGGYGLNIVDVSNPSQLIEIGEGLQAAYGDRFWRINDLQVGIEIVGDYVFLPNFDGGILVVDVSDPYDPEKITVIPMISDTIEVVAHHKTLYAAAYTSGLFAIDISMPENPKVLSTYYEGGNAMGLDVEDDYVYLAAWDRSVDIIDYSNPLQPVTIGQYDWPWPYNAGWIVCAMDVDAVGNYAYLSRFESSVIVLDISNPQYPFLQGRWMGSPYQRKTSTVLVYDDYLYATGIREDTLLPTLMMYHIQAAY